MSETNGPAELPVYSIAEAFVKRSGMYIGQPVTFERVHTFLLGFETAMLYVRDELARDRNAFQPVGVLGQFREQLRSEGQLRWDSWSLTIVAEAIGWTGDEPPAIDDLTEEQHLEAVRDLLPLLEKVFALPAELVTSLRDSA